MDKKYKKILFDVADSVSLNDETAIEYLKEQGVDVSLYVSRGIQEIKKKAFLRNAEINMSRHQGLIDKALSKIKSAIPETLANIENAIRQKNPSYQFRNLQELDEQQLREILEDVDLIDAIEGFDSKE